MQEKERKINKKHLIVISMSILLGLLIAVSWQIHTTTVYCNEMIDRLNNCEKRCPKIDVPPSLIQPNTPPDRVIEIPFQ